MMKRRLLLIISCCVVLLGAFAVANAQTKMPQMKFRERTLANGLRVLSVMDKASPTVAINVWYHVGSKDDPDQRSGFAHLFEHIMFKSTKNMKAEMMDRLTEDVGGNNNAFTADDVTVYFEVVPSNYLETLLWAEAERLSGLTVDEESFHSERAVVEEEFRQSILAPPYGKFFYVLDQKSFNVHPYKRPGIGSIEDLDAATVENVVKFHETYYRPDNATLIVVGDFDPKQLDAWVDKYFATITKPNLPLPRVQVTEPARTGEKRFIEYGSNVPLPGVGITYLVPSEKSEDASALTIADIVLSRGRSSRLYQSLVYQQQLAQSVNANADLREDAGLFSLTAIIAAGKKPEDAESSLRAEIKKLQDAPVSAAELEKAKNQIVTSQLRGRETNLGRGQALGRAAVLLGDPNRVNTDLERLQAVTAADVQRVAKKYFTDENRYVFYYLPESARPKPSTMGDQAKTTSSASEETLAAARIADSQSADSVTGEKTGTVAVVEENKRELPKDSKGKPVTGTVRVKVLIDEKGNVIEAKALSGHPLLRKASEEAAMKSKFSPTFIRGVAVKVSGEIVYNFVGDQKEKSNAK